MPDQPRDPNDWIRNAHVKAADEAWLRRRRYRNKGGPAVGGVILILAGIFLFLDNIGVLPVRNIWEYWPVIFLWFGITNLAGNREPARHVLGAVLTGLGALLLLNNLRVIEIHTRGDEWIAAVLMIAFGLLALMKGLEHQGNFPSASSRLGPEGRPATPPGAAARAAATEFAQRLRADITQRVATHGFDPHFRPGSTNRLHEVCVLGSVKRRVDASNFEGGLAVCVLGSLEIDLRGAHISNPARSATVLVKNTGGVVKIRIPENWRTSLTGSGILGTFEDKTIPPHTGSETPWLVITGYSVGGVTEIEN